MEKVNETRLIRYQRKGHITIRINVLSLGLKKKKGLGNNFERKFTIS
jgi:hypothetical protein